MNYRGFFKSLENINYQVDIITDTATTAYTEVIMAGSSPFIVTYNDSETPFDSSRISTATLTIVSNQYLNDVLSPYPQGTIVKLTDKTNNVIKWVGYLKPNLYNQGYESEYETIQLEASDCLASLQYLKYEILGDKKAMVSFKNILDMICDKCGLLDGWEITMSKQTNANATMQPSNFTISENNFFSSDTDESWKLSEVLDELCKYLGYTAIQWGQRLYLLDYQYLHSNTRMRQYYYLKSEGYSTIHNHYLTTGNTITSNSYRGNGADISFESIYNKATVNCNFYEVDEFLPDIFDDELITNRYGDMHECKQIGYYPQLFSNFFDMSPSDVQFPSELSNNNLLGGTTKLRYYNSKLNGDTQVWDKQFEESEISSQYFNKLLDNEYYESVYRDPSTLVETTPENVIETELVSSSEELSGFAITCKFTNSDNSSHDIKTYAEYYTIYWNTEDEKYYVWGTFSSTTFTLASGSNRTESIYVPNTYNPGDNYMKYEVYRRIYNEFYLIDGKFGGFMRYPSYSCLNYVGCTLTDLASVPSPTEEYNYETESSLKFKRYLGIKQMNQPTNFQDPHNVSESGLTNIFPCVYRLKSGYTMPIAVNSNSYLSIDANALFERYYNDYINSNWVSESTGVKGAYNFSGSSKYVRSVLPMLVLKLGIGDFFWDGSQWVNEDRCFIINLSTDKPENGTGPAFGNLWNSDHSVLNNVPWTDYAGVNGYKIPFANFLDMNAEVTFEIHMPSRIQLWHGRGGIISGDTDSYMVQNGYCWIENLKLNIGTIGSDKSNNTDCVYENVIEGDSLNELDEITVRFTTYPDNGKISYSNVCYNGSLLTGIKQVGLSGNFQKPEENIIEKYVTQYSTPTKKETLTTDLTFLPYQKIVDSYWNENFIMLGQQIDYQNDRQNITLIQIK